MPSCTAISAGLLGLIVLVEPYHALPMSVTKLRLLFPFRMGSDLLPVEQGWLARPGVPRHLAAQFAPVVLYVMDGTPFLTFCVSGATD